MANKKNVPVAKVTTENIVRIVPNERHSYKLFGLNNFSVVSEKKRTETMGKIVGAGIMNNI